jgi:hypothetical protein
MIVASTGPLFAGAVHAGLSWDSERGDIKMADLGQSCSFDLQTRSESRAREKTATQNNATVDVKGRAREAQALRAAINDYYGSRFPSQFDQSLDGCTLTVTKKAGASSLKIEAMGNNQYKLSGGSGPGGFGMDLAIIEDEASKETMMDELEDWFNIATS